MLTDTALRNLKPKEKAYKVTDRDPSYNVGRRGGNPVIVVLEASVPVRVAAVGQIYQQRMRP